MTPRSRPSKLCLIHHGTLSYAWRTTGEELTLGWDSLNEQIALTSVRPHDSVASRQFDRWYSLDVTLQDYTKYVTIHCHHLMMNNFMLLQCCIGAGEPA